MGVGEYGEGARGVANQEREVKGGPEELEEPDGKGMGHPEQTGTNGQRHRDRSG